MSTQAQAARQLRAVSETSALRSFEGCDWLEEQERVRSRIRHHAFFCFFQEATTTAVQYHALRILTFKKN